jgi:hypothetical protein
MAQADSNISTTAPVDSTRRRFLSQAAGVAAGSAVLATGATIPAPAEALPRVPDPILAAIEAHRAVTVELHSVLAVQSGLERTLPRDKRQSSIDAWEEKIIATDDPRWIECERAVHATFDAETDAAIELLNVRPATMLGLIALLQYVTDADLDGEAWPRELLSDDGTKTRSWHHFFVENLADFLPGMVQT